MLVGSNIQDLIPESQRHEVMDRIADLSPGLPVTAHEYKVKLPNGEIRWQRWTNRATFDEKIPEKIISYQSIGEDITERKTAQEALRISRQEYFDLYENAPNMYVRVDVKSARIIKCNQMTSKFLGYSKNDIIGQSVFKFYTPESAEIARKTVVPKFLKTGMIQDQEMQLVKKNREIAVVSLNATPVRDEKGIIVEARSIWSDITEAKRMNTLLQTSRKEWEAIFQAIGHPAIILDKNHKIIKANRSVMEITGLDEHALKDKNCHEIFHGKSGPPQSCPMKKLVSEGRQKTIEMEMESLGGHYLVNCTPLRDKRGNLDKIIHIATDVSDLKNAKENLRESKNRLNLAINAANLGMWDFNPTTLKEAHYSDSWFTMLGYEPNALPHTTDTWINLLHPDDRDAVYEKLNKHLKGEADYSVTFRLLGKDGDYRWIHSTGAITNWDDQGNPIRMIGVHLDITDNKISEQKMRQIEKQLQQAQKMEAIGNLAGGIAHDFNNILASVLGFAQIALKEIDRPENLRGDLEEIVTAGMRAKDLIQQILTFARQTDEKLNPVRVDIIIKEVIRFIRSSIPATIRIKDRIESKSMILGSTTKIHQVLMNLCTNSAHAMEDGGGVLEISLKDIRLSRAVHTPTNDLQPGSYIELKVSDTGIGIPEHLIESVFDPYFTTKRKEEGTGMGLAVVHGIVKSYGGGIDVESTLDKGTVFTIYLPAYSEKRSQPLAEEYEAATGDEAILFVDDEAPIVKMGRRILEQLGYTVTALTDSVDALERFKENPGEFDLVITDMTMPDLTGDKLAMEVLKIRPDIPILLCTGYSRKMSEKEASEIGIRAFLHKPIVQTEFAKTIRAVLDEPVVCRPTTGAGPAGSAGSAASAGSGSPS